MKRQMLVEDHAAFRQALLAVVFGHRTDFEENMQAGSLGEGRSFLADEEIDAAVVDLVLPDGERVDLIRELRKADRRLPVLALSVGEDAEQRARRALEGGHHSLPSRRSKRWPNPTIPDASPGRKRPCDRPLLPRGRRLRVAQPPHSRRYESLKRLADSSEVITLALFQQLRGVESERSFLRDAERFFAYLFPGVAGLHPSSFHRRIRKLRRFLEPLWREVLSEMVGDPETLVVDSALLSVLHPGQVSQGPVFPEPHGYAGEASASMA